MAKKDYSELTKEQLIQYIEKLEKRKKYGLVWDAEKVPEQVVLDCQNHLPVLEEVKELEIKTDETQPTHILIEGDNYHALSVLNYTHKGKIDLIYIDPPYNKGKDKTDFTYNDKFVDINDTYRHSKWLTFMKSRLELTKELMNNYSAIFISIDDDEVAQLKFLCNSVLGEQNFITMMIHKNNSSKNQANLISISTEYVLCYAKNKKALEKKMWKIEKKGARDISTTFKRMKADGHSLEEIETEVKNMYKKAKYSHLSRWNKVDEFGVFKDADLSREGGPKDYTIINPVTGKPCVVPDRGWGKSYEELLKLQNENLIWYGDDSTSPGVKDYITSEDMIVPDSYMFYDNSVDTRWQKRAFGKLVFNNPKPVEMIKHLIEMSTNKDSIILDFFAGSGTTGHAILDINKDQNFNLQFILCTSNENNICYDVTYPRIEKVIKGFTDINNKKNAGSKGNLRFYKTHFVIKRRNIDELKLDITKDCTEMLCIKESIFDLYKESDDWKIFKQKNRYMAVYYNFMSDTIEELKAEMNKIESEKVLYCFTLDPLGLKQEDFWDWENTRLEPIPQKILEVYKRIFKRQK